VRLFEYVRLVLSHGLRDFLNRSSIGYGLASLILSLWTGPKLRVSSLSTYDVAVYAAYALGFFFLFRVVLVAPYYLWRSAVDGAAELQAEVDKPAHIERQAMAGLRAGKRMELIALLRELQIMASKRDKDQWEQLLFRLSHLLPQATTDDAFEGDVTRFVKRGIDLIVFGKEEDRARLKAECLALIRTLGG
jgi:hypothetical protein